MKCLLRRKGKAEKCSVIQRGKHSNAPKKPNRKQRTSEIPYMGVLLAVAQWLVLWTTGLKVESLTLDTVTL